MHLPFPASIFPQIALSEIALPETAPHFLVDNDRSENSLNVLVLLLLSVGTKDGVYVGRFFILCVATDNLGYRVRLVFYLSLVQQINLQEISQLGYRKRNGSDTELQLQLADGLICSNQNYAECIFTHYCF